MLAERQSYKQRQKTAHASSLESNSQHGSNQCSFFYISTYMRMYYLTKSIVCRKSSSFAIDSICRIGMNTLLPVTLPKSLALFERLCESILCDKQTLSRIGVNMPLKQCNRVQKQSQDADCHTVESHRRIWNRSESHCFYLLVVVL